MTTQKQNDQRNVAVDLTAAGCSVTITYGVDVTLPFFMETEDGAGNKAPIDLTGATFEAHATRESGESMLQRTLPVTVTDAPAGHFNVLFPFQADPYPRGTYGYSVTMTDSVGTVIPLISSTLTFE
jgi:hypothetical protein